MTGVVNIPTIEISQQPASVVVTEGAVTGNLGVTAAASSGVLTYQWYEADANSNDGGTAITGETAASLTIPTDLTEGVYYYYCELGISGKDVTLKSDVAVVLVS